MTLLSIFMPFKAFKCNLRNVLPGHWLIHSDSPFPLLVTESLVSGHSFSHETQLCSHYQKGSTGEPEKQKKWEKKLLRNFLIYYLLHFTSLNVQYYNTLFKHIVWANHVTFKIYEMLLMMTINKWELLYGIITKLDKHTCMVCESDAWPSISNRTGSETKKNRGKTRRFFSRYPLRDFWHTSSCSRRCGSSCCSVSSPTQHWMTPGISCARCIILCHDLSMVWKRLASCREYMFRNVKYK